jgi:hypothetical protein
MARQLPIFSRTLGGVGPALSITGSSKSISLETTSVEPTSKRQNSIKASSPQSRSLRLFGMRKRRNAYRVYQALY